MKSKKILLIQAPFYRLVGSHFNSLRLGLCYIASVLNKKGHEAFIYNSDFEDTAEYANQREIFEGYKDYKRILSDLDHPIWKEVEQRIREFKPDIVGIAMLTATYKSALNVAEISKKAFPEVPVVVGGVHPSVQPEECLKNDCIDFAIVGEGEYSFLELIDGMPVEDIKGLGHKKGGEVIINPAREPICDLDALPFPERDNLLEKLGADDYGSIMTSRGCPFQCTYCASKQIWSLKVRFRSVENVFEEIKLVYEKYGSRHFNFRDDTFTLKKDRVAELCRKILDSDMKFTWVCDTRVDTLDKETLQLMKDAGCSRVKLGVESGSQRILDLVKKGITKDQVRNTVKLIKEVGIKFSIYLMIGFPTETEDDVKETMDFAKELDADYYSLSIVAPYFGTEIYEEFAKKNKETLKNHWEYFFHQSKEMVLTFGIDEALIDEFLALNELKGKKRLG